MPDTRPLTIQEIDDGWTLEEPGEEPYYLEYRLLREPAETPAPAKPPGKRRTRFKKRRGKRSRAG